MQHYSLRVARKRRGLSVRALAKLAGVHNSTVSRIERGAVRPLHEHVVALEQALGVPLKIQKKVAA